VESLSWSATGISSSGLGSSMSRGIRSPASSVRNGLMATAHGLTIVGLTEHFARPAVREAPVRYLSAPKSPPAHATRLRPVFKMQSGWTWGMLTIEVATAGRLIFCCDGRREDVRLPKSKGTNHSEACEILFNLAFADPQEFHTPASWEERSSTIRRRFGRLREQLDLLFPAPDGPFLMKEDRVYIPCFWLSNRPSRWLTSSPHGFSNVEIVSERGRLAVNGVEPLPLNVAVCWKLCRLDGSAAKRCSLRR